MTYEETIASDFFEAWFQKFLLPILNTPSVIIMDNTRFHRMGKLELLCEEFGHKLLPLSPYSPEYNKTGAHIKKHLWDCNLKGATIQYLLLLDRWWLLTLDCSTLVWIGRIVLLSIGFSCSCVWCRIFSWRCWIFYDWSFLDYRGRPSISSPILKDKSSISV